MSKRLYEGLRTIGRAGRRAVLSRHTYRLVLLFVYVGVSLFVLSLWMGKHRNIGQQSYRYLYGHPARPYAYRVLVPAIAKNVVKIVPRETRAKQVKKLLKEFPPVRKLMSHARCRPTFLPEFSVVLVLQFLSLLGFALVMRKFFEVLYTGPQYMAELSAVLATLLSAAMYRRAGYIYDLPQLFLFSAALLALCTQRWRWYYPLIVIGFLNKETSCLISLAFAAYMFRRIPLKSLVIHLAVQIWIFAVIRLIIVNTFDPTKPVSDKNNALRDYLVKNLTSMWKSNLFVRYTTALALILILALIIRHYVRGPVFLRRAMILLPPFLVAFLRGGLWAEIRVLGELYPLAFLLFFGGLTDMMGAPLEVVPEQQDSSPLLGDNVLLKRLAWLGGLLALGAVFAGAAFVGLDKVAFGILPR